MDGLITAMRQLDWQMLRQRFPRTVAAFSGSHQGWQGLCQVAQLEEGFCRRQVRRAGRKDRGRDSPELFDRTFDVVLAGGGLSLVYAAALCRAGLRVLVFDRGRIGCGHREWNISRPELSPLVDSSLFTEDEVEDLIRLRYDHGFCRFDGGAEYPVRGVLDCVIAAEPLLAGLRDRAAAAGATLLDYHSLSGYTVGPDAVTVNIESMKTQRQLRLRTRLLVDALGASSPHARFDLCCPTVGGVMEGLLLGSGCRELDPTVGEILVTTEGVQDGQQHIWEGFPAAAPASMTIYLFYYQRAAEISDDHPLLSLYERFFTTLPRYKAGTLRLLRPTYGFIPAYTRLGAMPAAPSARVLLVGDAAARHSPLTFCGFGSMIRSFWPITQGIVRLLAADRLRRTDLDGLWTALEPPALQVMGGLTLMMMPPLGGALESPDAINRLLDDAFATLAELGEKAYADFLQDAVDAKTFVRFMLGTATRHRAIYGKVFQHLTPPEAVLWLARLARFRWRPSSKRR